ncbi:MAG: LacI family transcriptional regulator [Alicyclobacillus sp.]|nr:LacI family transcriptional regulator [Alicyclobacillus sp.]
MASPIGTCWCLLHQLKEGSSTKVTVRDVAALAGVSPSTVSRVLNKPDLVDEGTKLRVRNAMESLHYQPNAVARSLSSKQADTIGVLVPGINDLFFDELYIGIQRLARKNNMKLLMYDTQHDPERVQEGFLFLKQHQVGGIIFTSRVIDEDYDPLIHRMGIPIVLTLTDSTGRTPLPAFKVDEVRAMFDVVSYLVSRGHRRIGMLAGDGDRTSELRLQGYLSGLEYYGIQRSSDWIEPGGFRFDHGYESMRRLLARQSELQLTAVCAVSDEVAIGAIRFLHDHGLHVPEDMSVVGFDDLRIAQMMIPALTTVRQPFDEIGETAVRCLMDMIQSNGEHKPNGVFFLPHRLVERESVKPLGSATLYAPAGQRSQPVQSGSDWL